MEEKTNVAVRALRDVLVEALDVLKQAEAGGGRSSADELVAFIEARRVEREAELLRRAS